MRLLERIKKIAIKPITCTNCNKTIWLEHYLHEEWLVTQGTHKGKTIKGNSCILCAIRRSERMV